MIFTEEDKAFVKIFVRYYRLWTTESYERILWQKMKYVWIDGVEIKKTAILYSIHPYYL